MGESRGDEFSFFSRYTTEPKPDMGQKKIGFISVPQLGAIFRGVGLNLSKSEVEVLATGAHTISITIYAYAINFVTFLFVFDRIRE